MPHKYITGHNTGQKVYIGFQPADVLRLHRYDTDTLCHKLASGNVSQDVGNKIPIVGRVQMKPRRPGQHINACMSVDRKAADDQEKSGRKHLKSTVSFNLLRDLSIDLNGASGFTCFLHCGGSAPLLVS